MVLHNVETNEEIWDYKATDKDLERVVKDNIVGLEGIAAKKKATADREQAWESLIKGRSVSSLPSGLRSRGESQKSGKRYSSNVFFF